MRSQSIYRLHIEVYTFTPLDGQITSI